MCAASWACEKWGLEQLDSSSHARSHSVSFVVVASQAAADLQVHVLGVISSLTCPQHLPWAVTTAWFSKKHFAVAVHSAPGRWDVDSQTQTSSRIGLVRLCSPEWLRGVRVSFRDDSLGAVFVGTPDLPGFQKSLWYCFLCHSTETVFPWCGSVHSSQGKKLSGWPGLEYSPGLSIGARTHYWGQPS